MAGIIQSPKRPPGWRAPGPVPPALDSLPARVHPQDGEDLCYLSGDYRILQLVQGNRWSLDELVTAWTALRHLATPPDTYLDLGTGVGSVLLMLAWAYPSAHGFGIEAQEVSAELCARSIELNGCEGRCQVIGGDLRDDWILPSRFPLITGTPPYFPEGAGLESEHAQCAPARFEHRGGIEDYVRAAACRLHTDGRFVVCVSALQRERTFRAAEASRLSVIECLNVVAREGKAPRIVVFTMAPNQATTTERNLIVRDRDGARTREYIEVRSRLGMPP